MCSPQEIDNLRKVVKIFVEQKRQNEREEHNIQSCFSTEDIRKGGVVYWYRDFSISMTGRKMNLTLTTQVKFVILEFGKLVL